MVIVVLVDLSKNPNIELYLLTPKQEEFLMSTNISNELFTSDYRYIFIRELFFPEDSNCPLDDSLFLLTIFETVNLFLYIFNPDSIINLPSKKANIKTVNELYTGDKQYIKAFNINYTINPLQKTIKKVFCITYDIETVSILGYKIPFKYKTKVGSFSRAYMINNFNDVLGSFAIIYDWFIDIMPSEFE